MKGSRTLESSKMALLTTAVSCCIPKFRGRRHLQSCQSLLSPLLLREAGGAAAAEVRDALDLPGSGFTVTSSAVAALGAKSFFAVGAVACQVARLALVSGRSELAIFGVV